ncbi:hypothetical protein AB0I28_07465 [Phytomonospora sp. NPDC050363]|uniref:hypothetical protein n=1 Tax=Phytomonospora sp. NPDC050363 TaxID=3155642 RepID=UPI0033FD33A3
MTATPPVTEDQVRARSYPHPALSRPVVRLIADGVAPGADVAMGHLGFGEPRVFEPTLTAPRRPLGYPAWALVNDPANASAALAASKELRSAAKAASAKPAAAVAQYESIAARLPIAHQPALFEQAARDFLDVERDYWAGIFFSKAREVEVVHALEIDQHYRQLSYIEFAVAGAVTVKALKSYAAELLRSHGGGEAYEIFLDLAMRRTKAGVPPWAGLPAQMKELAKAAGLDVDKAMDELAVSLLRLPSTRRAPAGFWTALSPILLRLCKSDEETRRRVVELFPEERDWWWRFLGRFDAAGSVEDVPGWLARAHEYAAGGYGSRNSPAELVGMVPDLAPRVDAPLDVSVWANTWGIIDADLVEACVAAGMPVLVPEQPALLGLSEWGRNTGLNTLATLEEWHPVLLRSVGAYLRRENARPLLESPALLPFATEVIESWIARTEGAGLADVEDVLDSLTRALTDTPVPPELTARIAAIDVAGALGRALRAGIFDEYHWPALDEAIAELKAVQGHSASWPVLTVWDESQAIAVGPQGIVARFRFPAGQTTSNLTAVYSDGQFLVQAGWYSGEGYWSGAPDDTFPGGNIPQSYLHNGMGYTLINPEGRRLSYVAPLLSGSAQSQERAYGAPHILTDGSSFWDASAGDGPPRRIDPKTGKDAEDQTQPALLGAAELGDGEEVQLRYTTLARLPETRRDSPLGSVNGIVGAVSYGPPPTRDRGYQPGGGEFTASLRHIDGRVATIRTHRVNAWWPHGLLTYPGGEEKVLIAQSSAIGLADPVTGAAHWHVIVGNGSGEKSTLSATAGGALLVPPAAYWHFFAPRSVPASRLLRAVTDETAAEILAADPEDRDKVIDARLPLENEGVTGGVRGLSRLAALQTRRRDKLVEREEKVAPTVDPARLVNATKGVIGSDWGSRYQSVLEQIAGYAAVLTGTAGPAPHWNGGTELRMSWHDLIGEMEALAWRAASPAVDEDVRADLLTTLDVWAGTVFADPAVSVRISTVDAASYGEKLLSDETDAAAGVRWVRSADTVISLGEAPTAIFRTRESGPGWGEAARLREFTALVRAKGPIPWDPAAAQAFAEYTGLTLATASWLLITVPLYDSWPRDVERDKLIRDTLGMKAKALAPGRSEAERVGDSGLRALYRGALPDDPAELWAEGGMRAVADHLAAAYAERHGRRTSVPESTVEAMAAYNPHAAVSVVLERMTNPASVPALVEDAADRLTPVGDDAWTLARVEGREPLSDILGTLVRGMFSAYYALPAGDIVRDCVPALARLIRERLAAPGLIFTASRHWSNQLDTDALRESLDGRPYIGPDGRPAPYVVDTGALIVEFRGGAYDVYVRPALVDDGPAGRFARTMTTGWSDPMVPIDLARSEGLAAIVDRIENGGLPQGAWEADPARSAPGLVAEVAAELGLAPDPAALYLQLLALAEPTDRNVKRWNDWTPARHKKAQTALVDAGLVVEATRARAGRKVFIAGRWEAFKAPMLPVETAKLDLYGSRPYGMLMPLRPIPELFAEAWRRRAEGSAPR